jgi:hypothetical protein
MTQFTYDAHVSAAREPRFFPVSPSAYLEESADFQFAADNISRLWELAAEWLMEIPEPWYYRECCAEAIEKIMSQDQGKRLLVWRELKSGCAYISKATGFWNASKSLRRDERDSGFWDMMTLIWRPPHCEKVITSTLLQPPRYSTVFHGLLPPWAKEPQYESCSVLEMYYQFYKHDSEKKMVLFGMLIRFTEFIVRLLAFWMKQPDCGDIPEGKWHHLGYLYAQRRYTVL